ncbi:intradiol ring-cleavage dioxygenase [Mycena rebaudengoi]|nr:intradiol ring-cleavage dioxygenase [Mycena rebaudengoi]
MSGPNDPLKSGANDAALRANQLAAEHGIDLSKLPQILDMSADSITDNVHAINSNCPDERMKFVFKNLINHLHDFVRETSVTTEEWMTAVEFLTQTGQKCTDVRQEFILLSDTLGVSSLVESINNAKPPGATEATVLGPFFTTDALDFKNGESIASEGKGEYMWVEGKVLDTKGNPIPGCVIDTWETDGSGLYDNQYEERGGPDCRGRLRTTEDGSYFFRAIVPIAYPIPSDGPVGGMVKALGRHTFRPAHLHMMLQAPGFEKLVTALYLKGDPYLTSDAVFGVKSSLIVETATESDIQVTRARGFKDAKTHEVLKFDFVLATLEEGAEARKLTMPKVAA